jgi:hypothetical protein
LATQERGVSMPSETPRFLHSLYGGCQKNVPFDGRFFAATAIFDPDLCGTGIISGRNSVAENDPEFEMRSYQ